MIGLGPGGASAAGMAAHGGAQVVAVERRAMIGMPVQCAEFIPLPLGRYATAPGVCIQRLAAMHTYLPSGTLHRADYPGLMIDRAAFDQALAAQAQAAGARLWTGTALVALDAANNTATLWHDDKPFTVRYQVLIGADGPHSLVAKAAGLAPQPCLHTRQYTVPLLQPHDATDFWLHDDYPGGYAWLFPKGQQANLGLGVDKRWQRELKTPLDRLRQHLIRSGRVGAEILARTGGAVPVGGLRPTLNTRNILWVGDAAGLTHPITGAGIAAAVLSGEMAGQAALDFLGQGTALDEYAEELEDHYGPVLRRALAQRQHLQTFWQHGQPIDDQTWQAHWVGA